MECLQHRRLADQIAEKSKVLQGLYEQLAEALSEATVHPETVGKPLVFEASRYRLTLAAPRDRRDAINALYVQCTKVDVATNGVLLRAKQLGVAQAPRSGLQGT